jgi:FtsP/CotA-like multicopper oxidase with cupredoxin domain
MIVLRQLATAAMVVIVLLGGAAFAQSNLRDRGFADLSDTAEALSDNAAEGGFGRFGAQGLKCFKGLNATGNSSALTLSIGFARYQLYNPSTDSFDTVNMRSYNGCPFGPTISINPGAQLTINLVNNLPAESAATCPPNPDHSKPHCFNTTNLHTHGLHVSPSGSADYVLRSVPPGSRFNYQFDIPASHPAGTFWYHPHRHGSTAIEVSSGMAGVLIVRGTRKAQDRAANGGIADIDTVLLKKQTKQPLREHVWLFEQIQYGCFANASASAPIVDPTTFEWACPSGSVGEIRNYTNQLTVLPDPRPGHSGEKNTTWEISGRYTQINGVVQPLFPSAHGFVPAGEIRRLRMVHGSNADTINVKIVRANLGSSSSMSGADVDTATMSAVSRLARAKSASERTTSLDTLCSGEVVKQLEFAVDGITRTAMMEKDVNTMDPGYRSDVLVAFPSPGLYCILDEAADASTTIRFRPDSSKVKDRRLLSFARVGPGSNIPDYPLDGAGHSKYWQYIRNQLVDANDDLPSDVRQDLRNLKTTAFAPAPAIEGVANSKNPTVFDIKFVSGVAQFLVDGKQYDPDRIDYTATLGTLDEWHVTAAPVFGHIFHIHTNPFQVTDIRNDQGQSIFDASGNCTAAEVSTGDRQYCGMLGVVRDTLFIKPGYTMVMRTRYVDYTGEYVMHCHILDHEDQGMMQNVSIVSPSTALLRRLTTPLSLASSRVRAAVEKLIGNPGTEDALAFSAPICSSSQSLVR